MGISSQNTEHIRSLDMWLRFDPRTASQHEAERGDLRRSDLSKGILLGLVFYNLYNLTSVFLMPDILWASIAMRVLVVTPTSLIIAYLVLRVRSDLRELMVLGGLISAFALPVGLFWLSDAAWSAYTFGELPLTLVFGNMVLALCFRHAGIFTVSACVLAICAVFTKAGLAEGLAISFALQIVTAGAFTLLANYMSEQRRCMDYLKAVIAEDRAELAAQETVALDLMSRTDPLTGLPNRRAWDDVVDNAFSQDGPLAILILDLDHFKSFNDTLGHPAGDACLRAVAADLARVAKENNAFAARFGGEEFVILVERTNRFAAQRLSRTVVRSIQALDIQHPGRMDGISCVSASIGLAVRDAGSDTTIAQMMGDADLALYEAKRSGRNRFCMAEMGRPKIMNG